MIGKTISHYKITEKLGEGGMGIVYKAQDLNLDRFVALKFLPPHLTTSEEEKQRFIHEAKAASALQHNNICTIHEIDETDDGQIFICMDCYEGETLDKRIKEKPLQIEETIDIAIQIAQGLAKAHEKEIVHRDIKPANIMLTKEGVVKVLDFGLAKLSTQTKLTKESTTLGTVSYMSPEQAKGEEVDYRTDIWSLGVILYEMLCGQLPFKGEYESAVIYSIMNDPQEPLTALRTGVPMELERIINKCLKKSPAARYQHVDELIVDLQCIRKQSESTGMTSKEETQKKRSKSVRLSVVILSILMLIVVGYLLIQPYWMSGTGWESSIAVLPFKDLSPEKDQEFFCDGVTEEILTNLGNLNKLKVIARTSVMKFKNTENSVSQIGKELNVENILEGSASKIGNRIRIHAQLVRSEDEAHLWSQHYDYEYQVDSIFAIYDDISERIATNLLAALTPEEEKKIKSNRPSNTEAYEFYLKGHYFHNKFLLSHYVEDFDTAENMLLKAIELDSNYVSNYSELADLYNTYYNYKVRTAEEKDKYLKLQENFIRIASILDSNSARVNNVKGSIYWAKGEIEKAYQYYKRSIELDINDIDNICQFGYFFINRGLYYQGIKFYNKAKELDPLYLLPYFQIGMINHFMGQLNEAEIYYKKVLEIDPKDVLTLSMYARLLYDMKKYNEAKEISLKFEQVGQDTGRIIYLRALRYAVNGEKEKALKIFSKPNLRLYLYLGMKEEAISILQDRFEEEKKEGLSRFLRLKNDTLYDKIRSDPRFQEILAKHKELYEENLKKYGDIDI